MTTHNFVPRYNDDGETLGTPQKQWSNVYTKDVSINGENLSVKLANVADSASAAITGVANDLSSLAAKVDVTEQGNDYIRYANGLQLCWGINKETGKTYTVVNYPEPFVDTPSVGISASTNNAARTVAVNAVNATNFQLHKSYADMWVCWQAVGWWK